MASGGVDIIVTSDKFPEIAAALPGIVSRIVRKTAFDLQALAADNAPVATGFLKSSIYVVTADASTYGNAGTPPKGASLLPEVDAPAKATEAVVAVGADYGVFVELGTSHMAAQPYLQPAVDAVEPAFLAAMSMLEKYLAVIAAL